MSVKWLIIWALNTTDFMAKFSSCVHTMNPDMLISSVSHFNSTSISDMERTGHEKGGEGWRECFVCSCVVWKVSDAPSGGKEDSQASSFWLLFPSVASPIHHLLKNVSSPSRESLPSIGADATQALRTFRFLFPPSPSGLDPLLSSTLSRRGGAEVEEEEREIFLFHTRSGLLSLFTLRLGNSFRFSRISCRKRGHGKISNCMQLKQDTNRCQCVQ